MIATVRCWKLRSKAWYDWQLSQARIGVGKRTHGNVSRRLSPQLLLSLVKVAQGFLDNVAGQRLPSVGDNRFKPKSAYNVGCHPFFVQRKR